MRNMSFSMTTAQIIAGSKTVTRRTGWANLMPGMLISPVRKGMGLRPGEKIERLRGPLRIVSVRRERLDRMTTDLDYGFGECRAEGFGNDPIKRFPTEFVAFFCQGHKCQPHHHITRIEFEYTDEPRLQLGKPGERP